MKQNRFNRSWQGVFRILPESGYTQNRPASSVIRCPETRSSVTRFWLPSDALAGAGGFWTAVPASDIQGLSLYSADGLVFGMYSTLLAESFLA